jgi:rare lipoprotein A
VGNSSRLVRFTLLPGLSRTFATSSVDQISNTERFGWGLNMRTSICLDGIFVGLMLVGLVGTAHAQVASIYGGSDGLCGHRTANGERLNCGALTAAHRKLPFGTIVRVCHTGCATVRINDRGPWVRGRDIDLSPAAARAIGLSKTGHVTISRL